MVILGMPWLAWHNPEIDWKMGEVKMTRCLEEYGKTVKANARKIQMAEIERRRGKERNEKGKWSKRKNNRCEESGRGVGNLR